jgi:hypothetical protein
MVVVLVDSVVGERYFLKRDAKVLAFVPFWPHCRLVDW